jgi:hypothetical protein
MDKNIEQRVCLKYCIANGIVFGFTQNVIEGLRIRLYQKLVLMSGTKRSKAVELRRIVSLWDAINVCN